MDESRVTENAIKRMQVITTQGGNLSLDLLGGNPALKGSVAQMDAGVKNLFTTYLTQASRSQP
jgi:hypothetical protein